MNTSIQDTLSRMEYWCATGNDLREKPLEALILLDLLRGALGYSTDTAISQVQSGEGRPGVADIALRINQQRRQQWIIIEIKRPKQKLGDSAIQQAGKYLVSLGAKRGIVTNGNTWFFIRVKLRPRATRLYNAEVLFRLELGETRTSQRKLLQAVLKRCSKHTIHGFFEMIEKLYEFGPQGIAAKMAVTPRRNLVQGIFDQIESNNKYHVNSQDAAILKMSYRQPSLFEKCTIEAYSTIRIP
jgi:predicted type IV restriction endonuclease